MNNRYKLMLDYINLHGKVTVNRRWCFSIPQTPELKWLLKKGHIKQGRAYDAHGIGHSYVYPTKPYEVKSLICPECGSNLYKLHPSFSSYSVSRPGKHAIDCSLRIDHPYDQLSYKHVVNDPKRRRK